MTAIQALLIGLVSALTVLDGDFFGESKFREPLVTGFLVGLILGDVKSGLIIGAQLQLMWMGATSIGLRAQLDIGTGGTIGTAIALMTGSGTEVAVAFGIPVAILMQFLNTLKMTGYAGFMHKADKYAEEGNEKGMIAVHYLCGLIEIVLYVIPTFVSVYFGNELIQVIVDNLPDWAMNGLTAVSALLPALGFAMLLQILIQVNLIPYFVAGFVLSAYLKMDMLAITLLAVAIAFVMYGIKHDISNVSLSANQTMDDEEDL